VPKGPPPVARLRPGKPVKLTIEQGIQGAKLKPPSTATVVWQDGNLRVAFDNGVDPAKPLKTGSRWGQDDAVEVALRNPAEGKAAAILVLRGFAGGHFESSTEAGAPEAIAKKAARAVKFAAKILAKNRWTAEMVIDLGALGIEPAKHRKLEFNLTVRKTAAPAWLMWRGTGGYSWDVANAGVLQFAP